MGTMAHVTRSSSFMALFRAFRAMVQASLHYVVGPSEEAAIETYGADRIEVYRTNLTPTEWTPPALWKPKNKCSAKVIVLLPEDASARLEAAQAAASGAGGGAEQTVLALHFFGPNAGEVTQGYAVAVKAGASWETFQDTVGIHPTTSEEFVYLIVTKSSGASADKQLCCG